MHPPFPRRVELMVAAGLQQLKALPAASLAVLRPANGQGPADGTYFSELRGRPHSERMSVRVTECTDITTTLAPDRATERASELLCLITTLLAGKVAELCATGWTHERSTKLQDRTVGRVHRDAPLEQPRPGRAGTTGHALHLPGPAPPGHLISDPASRSACP